MNYNNLNTVKSKDKLIHLSQLAPRLDITIGEFLPTELKKIFGSYIRSKRGAADKRAASLLSYIVLWYVANYPLEDLMRLHYDKIEEELLFSRETARRCFCKLEHLDLVKREVRRVRRNNHHYQNVSFAHLNIAKVTELLAASRIKPDTGSAGGGKRNHSLQDEFSPQELQNLEVDAGVSTLEVEQVIHNLRIQKPDLSSSSRSGIYNYVLKTIQNDTSFKDLAYYLRNFTPTILAQINTAAKRTYEQEAVKSRLVELIASKQQASKLNRFHHTSAFVNYMVKILRDRKVKYAEAKTFSDFLDSDSSKELQLNPAQLKTLTAKHPDVVFNNERSFKNYMLKVSSPKLVAEKPKNAKPLVPMQREVIEQLLAERLEQINHEAGRNFSLGAALYLLRKLGLDGRLRFYTQEGFIAYAVETFRRELQSEGKLAQLAAQRLPARYDTKPVQVNKPEAESCTEWVSAETTPSFFKQVKPRLLKHYGAAVTKAWFIGMKVVSFEQGILTLCVANNFMKDWLITHYLFRIIDFCKGASTEVKGVDIVVELNHPAVIRQVQDRQVLEKEKYLKREGDIMRGCAADNHAEAMQNCSSYRTSSEVKEEGLRPPQAEFFAPLLPKMLITQLESELIKNIGVIKYRALQLDRLKYYGKTPLLGGGLIAEFYHESNFIISEIQTSQGLVRKILQVLQILDPEIQAVNFTNDRRKVNEWNKSTAIGRLGDGYEYLR